MFEENDKVIHGIDSVVPEEFRKNTYAHVLPFIEYNYWTDKLFSKTPNADVLKDGEIIKEGVKRIQEIIKVSDWNDLTGKYVDKKYITIGNAVLIVDMGYDWKGNQIPRIRVAEGLVSYNEFLSTKEYVKVVENLTRGLTPIIKVTTYGKYKDTITYELGEGITDINADDKADVEKLLKIQKTNTHNLGFIRAVVSRNRADAEHYAYGQTELNGYEDLINNIDLTNNRINTNIDYNTDHVMTTKATGSILGADDFSIEEQQSGTTKTTNQTVDTLEGVSSVIISGDITLPNLREEMNNKQVELFNILGIQLGYMSNGKGGTNDTNNKVDKIGDAAIKRANKKQQEEKEIWTKVFEVCAMMDMKYGSNVWDDANEISIIPRINDFRLQVEMMDKIDKLSKLYPMEKIFMMIDEVSPSVAREYAEAKEEEAKTTLTGLANINNNNLPLDKLDVSKMLDLPKAEEPTQKVDVKEKVE